MFKEFSFNETYWGVSNFIERFVAMKCLRNLTFALVAIGAGLTVSNLQAGEPNYLFPDMVPYISEDNQYDYLRDWQMGTGEIRINTAVGNIGDGLFQIRVEPGTGSGGTIPTYQRVFIDTDNGPTYEDFYANDSEYHASHGHMHMTDFATFALEEVLEVNGRYEVGDVVSSHQKTSFFLIHVTRVPGPEWAGSPTYTTGNAAVYQNISRGWMDVYSHGISDQYVPLDGVPIGPKYWLTQIVDPTNVIRETDESNNTARVMIDLTQEGVAFYNPDGTLIQPGDFIDGNPADLDDDGDVDGDDFLIWQAGFGVDDSGDVDGDGDTDGDDFLIWQAEFGYEEGAGSGAVPEPSTIALGLLLAAAGLIAARRR